MTKTGTQTEYCYVNPNKKNHDNDVTKRVTKCGLRKVNPSRVITDKFPPVEEEKEIDELRIELSKDQKHFAEHFAIKHGLSYNEAVIRIIKTGFVMVQTVSELVKK